jgi:hypothetical protein
LVEMIFTQNIFFREIETLGDPMKSDVTEPINKNDTPKPDKARLMTRLFLDFTKTIIFFREICCYEILRVGVSK